MTEQQLGLAITGLIFMLVFGGIYLWSKAAARRESENFKKLAEKFPGSTSEIDEKGTYGSPGGHVLLGNYQVSMPFNCFTYVKGSGKSTELWTEFALTHNIGVHYELRLANEYLFHKIGKSTSLVKEIEIGNEAFDKMFLIQTEDQPKTETLLKKEVQDRLMAIPKTYFGEILIDRDTIIYKAGFHLDSEKSYNYFIAALDVVFIILEDLKRINR